MALVQWCSGFVGISPFLKSGAYISITWIIKVPHVHVTPG